MKRILIALALLATALSTAAQPLKPEMELTVWGRMPVPQAAAQTGNGDTVFFLDERIRLQVDLAWLDSSVVPDDRLVRWWDALRLTVTDPHGVVREIRGTELELIEVRTNGKLVAGTRQATSNSALRDATFVLFAVPPLPPGDFQVLGQMRLTFDDQHSFALRTAREGFCVRRGDEDVATRRLFLRKQAEMATDYEAFKKIELDLVSLEPQSPYLYEDIAIRSLNVAPPEETRDFYRKAYEGFVNLNQARDAQGIPLRPEERARRDQNLARLTVFEKLYDIYVARRGDLRLEPFSRGSEQTFAWVRKDGSIVGVVDVKDPMIVHPVDR